MVFKKCPYIKRYLRYLRYLRDTFLCSKVYIEKLNGANDIDYVYISLYLKMLRTKFGEAKIDTVVLLNMTKFNILRFIPFF